MRETDNKQAKKREMNKTFSDRERIMEKMFSKATCYESFETEVGGRMKANLGQQIREGFIRRDCSTRT